MRSIGARSVLVNGLMVMVCLTLAAGTHARATVWADTLTLSYHTVKHAPTSERGWLSLVAELYRAVSPAAAISAVMKAAQSNPDSTAIAIGQVGIMQATGQLDRATLERAARMLLAGPVYPMESRQIGSLADSHFDGGKGALPPDLLLLLADAALTSRRRALPDIDLFNLRLHKFRLEVRLGRTEQALAVARKLRAFDPLEPQLAMAEIELLLMLGHVLAARQQYSTARALVSNASKPEISARLSRIGERLERHVGGDEAGNARK